jgi:protein-S-isoprenylcysteine O-methyltransferase Ste14
MSWLILAVLDWGLVHSLLASQKAKELARRILGERGVRFYRLGYNIFACASFLPVLAISALTPDRRLYLVPLPWSGLMVLVELLAIAVLVIGFRQTDAWEFLGLRQASGPVETRQGNLVTNGMYRFVRHPLYSAGIAFIWLMPIMTVNVLAISLALTLYVVIGAVFEERKLLREFGQAYADYAAVTPMFIPFISFIPFIKGNKK